MTVNATDMSTPVTRGELREELGQFETRFDQKLEKLETRIDGKLEQLEERIDGKLEKLETRIDGKLEKLEERIDGKLEKLETRIDTWGGALVARIDASEQRVLTELARYVKAMQETLLVQVSVVDEQYKDLPGRVNRLEAAVFPSGAR